MAANNYFGFTPSGTQYSAQPASAYPAAQTAYVQTAQPTAYATAAARPAAGQTYDSYQATHTTGQYAYTAARPQPTATYDTKTYFAPAAAAPAAAATAVYTVAEASYQAAKPAYTSTNYTATPQARPAPTKAPPQATAGHSATAYVYPSTTSSTQSSTYASTATNSYSGYDAALYSAASNYYQQQQSGTKTGNNSNWKYNKTGGSTNTGLGTSKPKPKQPAKQPQLHYCEVCKISCAGPQTYREHLEGQKHKKKEAAAKGSAPNSARGQNQLRCELCDVACTGSDAYAAHIRGSKHQKVLKLHTKLGKPIPSTEPTVVSSESVKAPTTNTKTAIVTKVPTVAANPPKKIIATPKITFVGGTQLKTTGIKTEEVRSESSKLDTTSSTTVPSNNDVDKILLPGEKDVTPVGTEYIEEVKNEIGKTVSFNCKLCECKFNDPNAKEMHMKGRRHRLQYKKKVDPSLQVEVKPSIRARKLQEEKLRRQAAKEEYWRRRDAEDRWREEMRVMMEEEQYYVGRSSGFGRGSAGMPGPYGHGANPMQMRRSETSDDRHVTAKHTSIYPTEIELAAVQKIVSSCEVALKLVSNLIADCDSPLQMDTEAATREPNQDETKDADKKVPESGEKDEESLPPPRALKGVMRVGVLAKGLVLHGDLNVQLVLLCSEKPTRTLLERVADSLPKLLSTDETYEVKIIVEEAAVLVSSVNEPETSCKVTLTSPIMRDESATAADTPENITVKDPPDVLDRQKCLDALAALRHAKWFQARANGLQSCVMVIRILRDLCQRVPTWAHLKQWALELLVEKCVSSGGNAMSPGDALRRIFECLASGLLLPGGPGLLDPCEKDPMDAAVTLAAQEREDITASAQHALRLIAFRQIHKVLGMDALPAPRFLRAARFNPRKRRRTSSTGENIDVEEGKKDRKEEMGTVDKTDGKGK